MSWPDYFSGHARAYARFRPTYPEALFEAVTRACVERRLAWDCAAGNGQAAGALAARFARVIATDASADQLASAPGDAGYARIACRAEQAALRDASADLIVVAQALHWFAEGRFFDEVARVARPGAVLATWCYDLMRVTGAIDRIIDNFYRDPIGPHWAPQRRHIESGLRTVDVPFEEIDAPGVSMTASWTLLEALGYVATWSAVKRYRAATGMDAIEGLASGLGPLWGDGRRTVTWPLSVRAFRVG